MARKKKTDPSDVPSDAVELETPKSEEGDYVSSKPIIPEKFSVIAGALLASELRIGAPIVLFGLYRQFKNTGGLPNERFVEEAKETLRLVLTKTEDQREIESEIQDAVSFLNEMLSE